MTPELTETEIETLAEATAPAERPGFFREGKRRRGVAALAFYALMLLAVLAAPYVPLSAVMRPAFAQLLASFCAGAGTLALCLAWTAQRKTPYAPLLGVALSLLLLAAYEYGRPIQAPPPAPALETVASGEITRVRSEGGLTMLSFVQADGEPDWVQISTSAAELRPGDQVVWQRRPGAPKNRGTLLHRPSGAVFQVIPW